MRVRGLTWELLLLSAALLTLCAGLLIQADRIVDFGLVAAMWLVPLTFVSLAVRMVVSGFDAARCTMSWRGHRDSS